MIAPLRRIPLDWPYWLPKRWLNQLPQYSRWVILDLEKQQIVMSRTVRQGVNYQLLNGDRTLIRWPDQYGAKVDVDIFDVPLRRPWGRILLAALLLLVLLEFWRNRRFGNPHGAPAVQKNQTFTGGSSCWVEGRPHCGVGVSNNSRAYTDGVIMAKPSGVWCVISSNSNEAFDV